MDMDQFIALTLQKAKDAGIEAAEIYMAGGDSFRAMCHNGQVTDYTVNSTRGLSLRGLYNGKMGYAATEADDEDAAAQLVSGVIESAQLIEDDAVQEIYKGDEEYPQVSSYSPALDAVDEKRKLNLLISMEKLALEKDPRVAQVGYNMVTTSSGETRIVNSFGLNLRHKQNILVAYLQAVAKEGEKVSTGLSFAIGSDFDKVDANKLATEAVDNALFMLKAAPVSSGVYRAIIRNDCMPDLLGVFASVFSAENAQQGLSLLAGKEGEKIAASCVTLLDDPLLEGGLDSQPFDAEGVATRKKAVIDQGTLTTLLHNLKTARKAGCRTTGNASKGNYSAPVRVAPSNFYFEPGEKTLEQLQAQMGQGLVITELDGLHAGADAVSGDFSLLAKGYTVKDGKKDLPVEQITVAGNFYQLLKNIREMGSDLMFPGSAIGSPSVDIGEISVAGK